jgi:hypothetical protein
MSLYPYIYPYGGYPYGGYPYGGYPYGGYPYGGYPYGGYPYGGIYNNFKTDSLLNEYDELNQLAIQNHDIYLQNMKDDCKDCSRDICGNIIPCVMPPPMDNSQNVMRDIDLHFNPEHEFHTQPHLLPKPYFPPYRPPFHYPPFHHPPYRPPFHHPPYYPPYYPNYPPFLYRESNMPEM